MMSEFDRIVEGFNADRAGAAQEWANVAKIALRRASELHDEDPETGEHEFALLVSARVDDSDSTVDIDARQWTRAMLYLGADPKASRATE